MAKKTLTREVLENLYEAVTWISDPSPRGTGNLVARIVPAGIEGVDQTVYFYFQYSVGGELDRIPLGIYSRSGSNGTISLKEARERYDELSHIYKNESKNVRLYIEVEQMKADAERRRIENEKRFAKTVREAFDEFLATKKPSRARSLNLILSKWLITESVGLLDIKELDDQVIVNAMLKAKSAGLTQTHKNILDYASAFLNWCFRRRYIAVVPTDFIQISDFGALPPPRDRFLDEDLEVPLFLEKIENCGLRRDFQLILLAQIGSGCRIGETCLTRWRDLDFERRIWFIPKAHQKQGRKDLKIYMSDWLLEVFTDARNWSNSDEYVFATRGGKPHRGGEVSKYITARQYTTEEKTFGPEYLKDYCPAEFDGALKLPGGLWGSHDLRRTVATRVVRMTRSREIAHRIINHKIKTDIVDSIIDQTYIDDVYSDDLKAAWIALSDWLYQCKGKAPKPDEATPPAAEKPSNVVRVQFGRKAG